MSYVVEVDRRLRVRQGLTSPVRARSGAPLLEPGAAVELTVTVGVTFDDAQLDDRGRFFDTDAAAERVDRACAELTTGTWTELFDFRPTFELVARRLFERLAGEIPQLAFVQLADETFGSRTRYVGKS
jgi:6-pyruvoyltetrahydropterin/6-carboxytetrahydropterin synthase